MRQATAGARETSIQLKMAACRIIARWECPAQGRSHASRDETWQVFAAQGLKLRFLASFCPVRPFL